MRRSDILKNKYLLIGLFMTGLGLLLGIVGLFWTPYDPAGMSAAERFAAPSLHHLFGTDNFGRDIFSRVMKGLSVTILIGMLVVLFSSVMGILLGALTGYFGGILARVAVRGTKDRQDAVINALTIVMGDTVSAGVALHIMH